MPKIIQGKNQYACKHCGKLYLSLASARDCESSHDIVYVPIQRQDLKRLLIYLQTGNPEILSQSLLVTLSRYNGIKRE
jgi:hypothetical protein